MSIEENKEISRRYVEEFWNKKNISVIDDVVAPDCVTFLNGDFLFKRLEGLTVMLEHWTTPFPDLQVTVEGDVAEGELYASSGKLKGTHLGALQFGGMPDAIPPTGEVIEFAISIVCRISNGKITELRFIADYAWLELLRQA